MKILNQFWAISGFAAALAFSGTSVMAQGAGGFGGAGGLGRGVTVTSPAMLQQQADNMRYTLMVTNDDEWTVISPRLMKVIQLKAQMDAAAFAEMYSNMNGNRGSAVRAAASAIGIDNDPNEQALTKALTDEAPLQELKSVMARLRNSRKAKRDEIAKAQADLQAVVSVRQEAILLSRGYLE
jgi:hypothetical protein